MQLGHSASTNPLAFYQIRRSQAFLWLFSCCYLGPWGCLRFFGLPPLVFGVLWRSLCRLADFAGLALRVFAPRLFQDAWAWCELPHSQSQKRGTGRHGTGQFLVQSPCCSVFQGECQRRFTTSPTSDPRIQTAPIRRCCSKIGMEAE